MSEESLTTDLGSPDVSLLFSSVLNPEALVCKEQIFLVPMLKFSEGKAEPLMILLIEIVKSWWLEILLTRML